MRLCYIDESGDTGAVPHAASPVQPVLVISAVVLDHNKLTSLTHGFIDLKRRFSPNLAGTSRHRLDAVLNELKGNDIRRDAVSSRRRESRRAIGFLDRFMDLLELHRVRIFGRVWIKQLQYKMDAQAIFASSTQAICQSFQQYLDQVKDTGFVIADSRMPRQNMSVAHAIFTQKFKFLGDPFPRILEMPTFGTSNNHVGLQVADIVASAMLFLIAAFAYCSGHITNTVHVKPEYESLRKRYGERLCQMQFRHHDKNGRRCGGVTVSDGLGHKNGAHIFRDCNAALTAATAAVIPAPTPAPPVAT